jgi:hypothetical protein
MKKFTCRFDIQIPNEPKFRVARKIIGYKGGNMKRIIDMCKLKDPNNKYGVKLRLRGKGSGFKEGPEHKESEDALHLCVSSQFVENNGYDMGLMFPLYRDDILLAYEVFRFACRSIESLLVKIYKDYETQTGVKLQVRKFDNNPAVLLSNAEGYPPNFSFN